MQGNCGRTFWPVKYSPVYTILTDSLVAVIHVPFSHCFVAGAILQASLYHGGQPPYHPTVDLAFTQNSVRYLLRSVGFWRGCVLEFSIKQVLGGSEAV